ncbi:MAG TPA: hypothetical protein VNY80_07285 [Steroidobacteraceae bacterium]|jgi:hypothetical protein|nr:hypothetical protein [Steroidobacteraceae bacterium]
MADSRSTRANVIALIAIMTASASIMLWLFWRFPLTTAIITVAVLTLLGLLGALARSIEAEIPVDRRKQIN